MRSLRLCFSLLGLMALAIPSALRAADAAPASLIDGGNGEPAGFVAVPAGLKTAQIQAAILQAALRRGWTIQEKSAGKIVVHHESGRWVSTVTLLYDTSSVQVFSKSFRSGKPRLPDWVRFLKQDIAKDLANAPFVKE